MSSNHNKTSRVHRPTDHTRKKIRKTTRITLRKFVPQRPTRNTYTTSSRNSLVRPVFLLETNNAFLPTRVKTTDGSYAPLSKDPKVNGTRGVRQHFSTANNFRFDHAAHLHTSPNRPSRIHNYIQHRPHDHQYIPYRPQVPSLANYIFSTPPMVANDYTLRQTAQNNRDTLLALHNRHDDDFVHRNQPYPPGTPTKTNTDLQDIMDALQVAKNAQTVIRAQEEIRQQQQHQLHLHNNHMDNVYQNATSSIMSSSASNRPRSSTTNTPINTNNHPQHINSRRISSASNNNNNNNNNDNKNTNTTSRHEPDHVTSGMMSDGVHLHDPTTFSQEEDRTMSSTRLQPFYKKTPQQQQQQQQHQQHQQHQQQQQHSQQQQPPIQAPIELTHVDAPRHAASTEHGATFKSSKLHSTPTPSTPGPTPHIDTHQPPQQAPIHKEETPASTGSWFGGLWNYFSPPRDAKPSQKSQKQHEQRAAHHASDDAEYGKIIDKPHFFDHDGHSGKVATDSTAIHLMTDQQVQEYIAKKKAEYREKREKEAIESAKNYSTLKGTPITQFDKKKTTADSTYSPLDTDDDYQGDGVHGFSSTKQHGAEAKGVLGQQQNSIQGMKNLYNKSNSGFVSDSSDYTDYEALFDTVINPARHYEEKQPTTAIYQNTIKSSLPSYASPTTTTKTNNKVIEEEPSNTIPPPIMTNTLFGGVGKTFKHKTVAPVKPSHPIFEKEDDHDSIHKYSDAVSEALRHDIEELERTTRFDKKKTTYSTPQEFEDPFAAKKKDRSAQDKNQPLADDQQKPTTSSSSSSSSRK